MNRLIIGVDPGVTSGVCSYWEQSKHIQHAQPQGISNLMLWLQGVDLPSLVVIEDFLGSGHRHPDAVKTIQTVGAVKGWCAIHDVKFVMHTPQWRKPFVKQARQLLDVSHSGRHAADALAHVLSFLYREEHGL